MTRVRRLVLVTAALASFAGCSFTSLDGLTGGDVDAADTARDAVGDAFDANIDGAVDAKIDGAFDVRDAAVTPPPVAYRDAVLADAPAAYYRLDEDDATMPVRDETGTYPGRYIGTVTPGVLGALPGAGKALQVDGSGGVDLGNHFGFGASPFAFEVWFKPATGAGTLQRVFARETISPRNGYSFLLLSDRAALQRYSGGTFLDGVAIKPPPPFDVFKHVVVSFDGARLSLYENGSLIDGSNSGGTPGEPNLSFALGGIIAPTGRLINGFKGALDEFAVYTHPLTASRVTAHFAAAQP